MKKKNFLHLMAIMMAAMLSVGFASCSSDDDEKKSNSKLLLSFQNTKNGIIGTWIMDSYHSTSRAGNPYTSMGWDDSWPYKNFEQYKYTFSSDGKVTDNKGNTYSYVISLDETEKVYYGNDDDDFYWPFAVGSVVLNMKDKYDTKYYVEIKKDGLLYLYNYDMRTGGSGVPEYRYKKIKKV